MAKVNLNKFRDNIINAAQKGLLLAAKATERRLKSNIGLDDHNAESLANLGHPYGKTNPSQIHNPDWLVHTKPSTPSTKIVDEKTGDLYYEDQTGFMLENVRVIDEDNGNKYAIGVDPKVPYLNDVIGGTSKMRARNFPLGTLNELKDEKIIYNIMERELDKVKV